METVTEEFRHGKRRVRRRQPLRSSLSSILRNERLRLSSERAPHELELGKGKKKERNKGRKARKDLFQFSPSTSFRSSCTWALLPGSSRLWTADSLCSHHLHDLTQHVPSREDTKHLALWSPDQHGSAAMAHEALDGVANGGILRHAHRISKIVQHLTHPSRAQVRSGGEGAAEIVSWRIAALPTTSSRHLSLHGTAWSAPCPLPCYPLSFSLQVASLNLTKSRLVLLPS